MDGIGGNITVSLQVQAGFTRNGIGERVPAWHDVPVTDENGEVIDWIGWLDLQSGDSKHNTYNAKMQESTHVFLSDYVTIPDTFEVDGEIVKVNAETTRMVANSQRYDVMLIDDPMGLHEQLEVYLKYTGGQ